jgi:beta-lactam-binding protein with PASTA domain
MEFSALLKKNPLLKNLILAVCFFLIFIALIYFILNVATRHGQAYEVPDLEGMTMDEARVAVRPARLRLEVTDSIFLPQRPAGTVLEQHPAPSEKVKSRRRIFLTVNAFTPKKAEIPFVTGFSLRQAKNNLEVAGFGIEKLIYKNDIATNNILEQQYRGRTITATSHIEAPTGSNVTLIVGRSAEGQVVKVPKVIGSPLKDAKSRLWESGLNVGKITRDKEVNELNEHLARVSSQTPGVGTSQTLGSTVNLRLTLDEAAVAAGNKTAEQSARRAASEAAAEETESAE